MVFKIQPQTFKSSYIKLIALLCSLVYSLVSTVFVETIPKDSVYNACLGVIIGCGVVYLNLVIAYMLRNLRKDYKCFRVIWLVDMAYIVTGVLYYVGKNLLFLAVLSSNENQCATKSCLVPIQITQYILLGMVVVFYRFIPFVISKYYQSNLVKQHQTTEAKLQLVPEWILAAESLTLLVEFDALYTIIVNSIELIVEAPPCSTSAQLVGFWVIWALFVLMYMFILYYTINSQYRGIYDLNCSRVTSHFLAIILLGAFGSFLMGNNFNPLLLCYIGDSRYAQYRALHIFMKVFALAVVFLAIILLLIYRCMSKARQEKLLPRVLRQQLPVEPDEQTSLIGTINNNEI